MRRIIGLVSQSDLLSTLARSLPNEKLVPLKAA
jgi:CBS domain-containing membrane protein